MATRVKITGLGQKFLRTQLITIKELSNRQIKVIADETQRVIQREITSRITRTDSEGNLANSFVAVEIPGGWGVGDIDFLNQNAKYWYWQNFGVAQTGRKTPPASRGQFSAGVPQPTPGQTGSRFFQSNTGGFLITPNKPIEAKNYIQATVNQINQIIASVVKQIKL